jgi:hypothetical protein
MFLFCTISASTLAAQEVLLDDWFHGLLTREVEYVNGITGIKDLCGKFRTEEFDEFRPEWTSTMRGQVFFRHRRIGTDILAHLNSSPLSAAIFGASIVIEYSPVNLAAKGSNAGICTRFLVGCPSFASILPQFGPCSMSEEESPYAVFPDSDMETSPAIYSSAIIVTDTLTDVANATAWLYTDVATVSEHYLKQDARILHIDNGALIQDARPLSTATLSGFAKCEPPVGGNIFCCRRNQPLTAETFLSLSRLVRNMGIANHLVFTEKEPNGVHCYLNEMTTLHPNGSVLLSHDKDSAGNALWGYQCRIYYGSYLRDVLALLPFNAERSRTNMAQLQIQYYGEGCSLSEQEQMIAFIAGCSFPRSRLPDRCSVLTMDKDLTDIVFDGPIYGGMKNAISFKRSQNRWIFSGYSWTNRSYKDLKAAFFPRASRNDANP